MKRINMVYETLDNENPFTISIIRLEAGSTSQHTHDFI